MHNANSFKYRAFILSFISYFLFSAVAYAADATLYLSPPAGTYTINDHAMIRVFVSSDGAPVYGVEGVLVFDPLKVNVVSVSHEASVLTSWPTPPAFDNEKGEIYFGGILSTSTVLDRGHVFSIVITPLRAEDFRLAFASGAAILAGDGTGGNIVSTLKSGDYIGIPRGEYVSSPALLSSVLAEYGASSTQSEVIPENSGEPGITTENSEDDGEVLGTTTKKEIISSPSHPDQEAWYALATSTFVWDMPTGVRRVRLALNNKPEAFGTITYPAPMSEKIYSNITEGIQYFHLTREWNDGHTDGASYRIQTDRTPPGNLSITEKTRADSTDPRVIFLLSATDTLSGVDRYEIIIDDGLPITWIPNATGEYSATALTPGTHEIMAKAIDKAGNATPALRLSFAVEYLPTPSITLSDKKFIEGKHLEGQIVSRPNDIATLFIKRGDETVEEEIALNTEGSAAFTSALTLSPGTYEVWVTSHDVRGAISKESERLTFEAAASLMGIIKRHPLIPIVSVVFIAFLFAMRFFWKKLHSSDDAEDDDNNDTADEIPRGHHPVKNVEGTVVLTAVKHKQGISIS